ncbi:hypothetical protein [Roseovarius mucosus]|uniref:hypothetical protein n=1 Tax=Roseovarius mucosus TaxID=215743 RepID=UPI0035D1155C
MSKHPNGRLPADIPRTAESERLLRAEIALLMRNLSTRTQRHRREGFKLDFARFATLCDDDSQLARRVLLASGWCPDDGGNWIIGQGLRDIDRAISWEVLESTIESILNDYRPIDDDHSRPIEQAA